MAAGNRAGGERHTVIESDTNAPEHASIGVHM